MNEENYKPNNSGIDKSYNIGPWNPRTELLQRLMNNEMRNAFFDQLRTKEQLGYCVWSIASQSEGMMRHRFVHAGNLHPRIIGRKQLTIFFAKKYCLEHCNGSSAL